MYPYLVKTHFKYNKQQNKWCNFLRYCYDSSISNGGLNKHVRISTQKNGCQTIVSGLPKKLVVNFVQVKLELQNKVLLVFSNQENPVDKRLARLECVFFSLNLSNHLILKPSCTKTKFLARFLRTRKSKLWQPFLCVKIQTLFRIKKLQKYFGCIVFVVYL